MRPLRVVIAYGSTYGDTADAAERIARALDELTGLGAEVVDIGYGSLERLLAFDILLLGCSTWDGGELQSDWAMRLAELDALDLHGKRVGLFGCGDQLGYPDTFMDALGILAGHAEARGAELVGLWSALGYGHTASLAQRECCFVGLALDATCQPELTPSRIDRWVLQLVEELDLGGARALPEREDAA